MVGFCHGGNMPASHNDDGDDEDHDDEDADDLAMLTLAGLNLLSSAQG